jgi:hypothetical protein
VLSPANRSRVTAPLAVFALVLALRAASLASLVATPLASWHLWMETDEHAYVEWSARLAAGNWADVPAYRAYFNWQREFGPPETWERWYQKNAYYAGPLYPYVLAILRVLFGSPFLPARLLQLLLACLTSAFVAKAVQRVGGDFLGKEREESGRIVFWSALAAGVLYGSYGPLVFHDFFLYRDGPVAHLSTLLVVLPFVLGGRAAFGLGLLGGAAVLMKQTVLPLAAVSLYSLSKKSPGDGDRRRSLAFGALGLALPLSALFIRNVYAGVPPLTFDTRQAIGLAWGNGFGADATTNPPPNMKEILEEAAGSTAKTAKIVLEGYREAPLELPKLFLKKLETFFNVYEVPDNANFYFFRDRLGILKVLPVFPCLLGAGVVGLFAARKSGGLGTDELLLAGVAILTPLAACLLVQTTSRYRVGAIGPLALGCGLFLFFALEEVRGHRLRRAGILALSAGLLSLVPLRSSVIYAARHRFSDTLVYATLAEAERGPESAAEEVRRYVEEGGDDRAYDTALRAFRNWVQTGERTQALVEPSGIAPPGRRLREFPKTSRDALFSR